MNLVTALALAIGAMSVLLTWLFVGPMAGLGLSLWAAFIAWGSFFHCGGGEKGLQDSLLAAIWGAVCATVALVLANSGALASASAVGRQGCTSSVRQTFVSGSTVAVASMSSVGRRCSRWA